MRVRISNKHAPWVRGKRDWKRPEMFWKKLNLAQGMRF